MTITFSKKMPKYIALIFFPIAAFAQWTPIRANETKATTIIDSTGKTHILIKKGTYDRSSTGETAERLIGPRSKTPEVHIFNKNGYFILDPAKKEAVQMSVQAPQSAPPKSTWSKSLGQDTVSGIACVVLPIDETVDGKTQLIGKACIDEADSLMLKQDFTIPAGKASTHIVSVLSNITRGEEPSPDLFGVPDGYKVVPPTPSHSRN